MSKNLEMVMEATNVFQRNSDAYENELYKIIVNQGGSRSSKTWSILQLIIVLCLRETGLVITISRKTSPSLKKSVIRDFVSILKSLNLYVEANHNKTEMEYRLNGNLIEFVSMDMPQKKRGSKRHILWLNEANEFDYEDYFQLMIRTTGKIFLDYNPSDEYHWIYDKVLVREDCIFIKSTYKDNPFLENSLVEELERLEALDPNYWKIYGLGEIGKRKSIIYDNWDLIDCMPDNLDDLVYGVDFGFNNPSVVVEVGVKDRDDLYIDEKIYQSGLTTNKLIERMKEEEVNKKKIISADSAEPDRIEEMQDAGYLVEPVKKSPTSVKDGINLVKSKRLHITKSSTNILKEIKSYKWKEDKLGNILDEPLKFNDHSMDGIRYAVQQLKFPSGLAIQIFDQQLQQKTVFVPSSRASRERAGARMLARSNR